MRRCKGRPSTGGLEHIGTVSDRVVESLTPETHPIIWKHWPRPSVRPGMGREVWNG
jgi:hypothetical protein